jgi:hypothetical protein
MTVARLKHLVPVVFPVFLALYLYRRSFRIWFLRDDFAWLGLRLGISDFSSFLAAMFAPMAQGTVRFLSERAFFLGFESAFGLESLPMRIWMFLTLAAALVLLTLVTEKLTGSRWIGMAAALFWSLNFGVSVAMSWLSSYNQILISALMLGALYATMQGRMRWAWVCFLLGFGALESVIMIPPILLMWAWLYEREKTKAVLPMFVPAALFAAAHLWWIPKPDTGNTYKMFFDRSLLESVGIYWQWMLGAVKLSAFSPDYLWMEWPALLGGTALLGLALYLGWRRKDAAPWFGLAFSLAAMAPMLPLREHRSDYYLASGSIGIMILFASALKLFPMEARWVLGLCLASYLYPSFLLQRDLFEYYLESTGGARVIVRGAMHAHALHPEQMIVLDGVSSEMFQNTVADDGLRLISGGKLRIAPGSGVKGSPWVLSPEATRAALEKNSARIYRLEGPKLRDVTREWEQTRGPELAGGFAPEVFAAEAAFASQFVEGWYAPAEGSRWMSGRAMVRLGGGPYGAGATIRLRGFVPPALGETKLRVLLDRELLGEKLVAPGEFVLEWPVPENWKKESVLPLWIESTKTVRPPGDGRVLSLVFGEIGVR